MLAHATTHARTHRSQGQPALPRSHDVRRLGQPRPRRVHRDHPPRARRGINFIDTADVYARGESEEIVGKALAGGRRDNVFLATKVHGTMGDDPNQFGNSRRWIVAEVENSLRRLGTDWIDLYQIHRPELDTDIDDTLGALTDLVRAGKVRYIGSSTFPPSAIVEAQWVAERRVRERFVCEQPPYSILVRGVEADVLPTCRRYGMGVIPWSPLAGGWLTGRYRKGQDLPETHRAQRIPQRYDMSLPGNQAKLEAADALAQLAEEAGLTLIDMALAFVLRHPAVTAPIIGPRTMEQLESQLGAADVTLSDDILDRIDEIVPPGDEPQRYGCGVAEPGAVAGRAAEAGLAAAAAAAAVAAATPWARRSARVTGRVRARATIGTARATMSHMTALSP
jgi:aryl-alcohol dehydrogenase-like predicted oxidoreductase